MVRLIPQLPPAHLLPAEIQGQATGVPITERKLCDLLAMERVQTVRVVTRTYPKFRRGSPFRPRSVVRLCVRVGFVGADYQSVVHRQRVREGMDLSGAWARVPPGPLWGGKGQPVPGNRHLVKYRTRELFYLVLYPQTDYRGVPVESFRAYFDRESNAPLDRELVERWRRVSKPSNYPRTKKKIPWRLPCLGSIVSITLGGTNYTLVGKRSVPVSAESKKTKAKPVTRGVEFDAEKKQRRAPRKLNPPSPELKAQIDAAKSPTPDESNFQLLHTGLGAGLQAFPLELKAWTPPEMEYVCGRVNMRGDDSHRRLQEALNKTPPGSGWSVMELMNWGTFCIITWQRAKEEPAAAPAEQTS